jgi:hypothetical protein
MSLASLPLLALLLSAQPRVFLSVDRVFLPGAPGSVVHVELEGAEGVDVRLYQLRDPERFLGGSDDALLALSRPATAPRAPSAPALLARGAASARQSLHAQVEPLLTPDALEAVRLLAPGSVLSTPQELPFLRGEPLLRRWTLPCGGDEAHHFCDVDLGPLPAGVYLVEGVAGSSVGHALALVSRLALAGRHSAAQLQLFAADARTGEPRAGVQVTFEGAGQPAQRGLTSAQGLLLLRPGGRSGRALGHAGSDWALLELPAVAPRARGARLVVTPIAGEVRPGDRVRFLGVERPAPGVARELAATLEDGRGSVVAAGVVAQDAQGLFTGVLDLPEQAAPGLGHVVVEVDGKASAGELWIHSPPRADFTARASLSIAGSTLHLAVQAEDGAGRPAVARVEWRLLRLALADDDEEGASPEVVQEGEAESEGGAAQVEVSVPEGPDARFILEAAAIDGWGHRAPARAEAVRLRGKVHLTLQPQRRIYAPGEIARLRVSASDAEGLPVGALVTVRTTVSRMGQAGEASRLPSTQVAASIPASGQVELSLPALQAGYMEVEAEVDGARLAETVLYVSAHGGDIPFTPDALTLIPDRLRYAPGETARVLLFAPFESGSALVTVESGELTHSEVLAVHGSSALLTHKILPGAPAPVVSAVAVLDGQSFAISRTLGLSGAGEPGSLQAQLEPGPKAGTLVLTVHARDAAERPVAGADLIAAYRNAEAAAPLAPPLAVLLDPPPTPEGRTDVSLDFHSAGQSVRAAPRPAAVGPGAFTPQKGMASVVARAPHAVLEGLERMPPTDRTGVSRLTIATADAPGVEVQVTAALPAPDLHAPPSLLQVDVARTGTAVSVVPELPRQLRPGDHALARMRLRGEAVASTAVLSGRSVPIAAGATVAAVLAVDAQHPTYQVESAGRLLLSGRVAIDSGEEWLTAMAGEASQGSIRVVGEGEAGTVRVRAVGGPAGLLQVLARDLRTEPRSATFEGLGPGPLPPTGDERLAALAVALAHGELRPDPAVLSSAAAGVVAVLEPSGELAAFRGGPSDPTRTAVALWLLTLARDRGAGVPFEWLERMRSHLQAVRPRSALVSFALGEPLAAPGAGSTEALAAELLQPTPLTATRTAELVGRLERRAGVALGRACWSGSDCDPRSPASIASLTETAWACMALARVRPHAPRLPAGLRYLLGTREQAIWGRGLSGALIPLALAAGRTALPDRAATLRLTAAGSASEVKLVPGEAAVLFGSSGPATLRVKGGPIFFEVARARAEPREATGELTVERQYFVVKHVHGKLEHQPVTGRLPRGAEVLIELTVTGAPPGSALRLEDWLPAGLEPISQGGTTDPASALQERGGALTAGGSAVRLEALAGEAPLVLSHLARARLAGHYLAPAAQATAGELSGTSGSAELDIEEAP